MNFVMAHSLRRCGEKASARLQRPPEVSLLLPPPMGDRPPPVNSLRRGGYLERHGSVGAAPTRSPASTSQARPSSPSPAFGTFARTAGVVDRACSYPRALCQRPVPNSPTCASLHTSRHARSRVPPDASCGGRLRSSGIWMANAANIDRDSSHHRRPGMLHHTPG